MTTTLTHPAAEDLGRFVEGTLPEPERSAVVAHLADCNECRIIVVDATEFADEPAIKRRSAGGQWWSIAASVVLVAAAAALVWNARRERPDPAAPMIEASAHLKSPIEGRLSKFAYLPPEHLRGSHEADPGEAREEFAVATVLEKQGSDPKTQHALGEALLISAERRNGDVSQESEEERKAETARINEARTKAVQALQAAVAGEPKNAAYLSDLAAVLITKGDSQSLHTAVDVAKRALSLDPRSLDALFNLAKALQSLNDRQAAIDAYGRYLKVDHSSPWADEARSQLANLREELSQP